MLTSTVNTWYEFFRKLALLFYLIFLVYLGFKIILTSTAEKKADYKLILTAWTMGIAMLFCFPYVMKYTIKINHAVCTSFRGMASTFYGENGTMESGSGDLADKTVGDMFTKYGKNEFVKIVVVGDSGTTSEFEQEAIPNNLFGSNAMMRIRFIAGVNKDLPLTIIYCIMIGQLIALLIMYYKRVFMLSFLITMFPLVCIIYPLNRIGDIKINSFGIWFKEFLVNVFVQTFHAATYSVVVSIGVNAYIENDNWLLMLMCILFLFEGEKIIRGLFNAKSTTGSIGDLAASGALAWSVFGKANSFIPTIDFKRKGGGSDTGKEKAKKDREGNNPPTNPTNVPTPGSNANGLGNGGSPIQAGPTMQGENVKDGVELGRNINSKEPSSVIKKAVDDKEKSNDKTLGSKIAKGAASTIGWGAQNLVGAPLGGLVGMTAGLAQTNTKDGMENAVNGTVSGYGIGKQIGGGVSSVISTATNHISRRAAGIAVGKSIMSGDMDSELGIDDAIAGLDAAAAKKREEAIRKVFAKAAKRSETGAEIKILKETIKRTIN